MKLMRLLMAVGLVLAMGTTVQAAEREDLQRVRGSATPTGITPVIISGSSEWITGVLLNCTGTACAAGLYDNSSALDTPSLATLVFDLSAAANGTTYVNLSETPIRVTTGIQAVVDANARAIVVYTQQATP